MTTNHQCHRQTDRQTDRWRQHTVAVRICALHGNNIKYYNESVKVWNRFELTTRTFLSLCLIFTLA